MEENLSNGALPKIIVKDKFQPPNNENRILSCGISHSDMSKICNWPFSTTKNTKLVMFQFKLVMASSILKIDSRRPTSYQMICVLFVEKGEHTIKHMFLQCSHVITFWQVFYSWGTKNTKINVNLADSAPLYGLIQPCKYQQVLSLALLIAKCSYINVIWLKNPCCFLCLTCSSAKM